MLIDEKYECIDRPQNAFNSSTESLNPTVLKTHRLQISQETNKRVSIVNTKNIYIIHETLVLQKQHQQQQVSYAARHVAVRYRAISYT